MNLRNIAKILGRRGGRARALKLNPEKRRQIASQGGLHRARSYQIKKLIEENFRYLEAVEAISPRPDVIRSKDAKNPLPGI